MPIFHSDGGAAVRSLQEHSARLRLSGSICSSVTISSLKSKVSKHFSQSITRKFLCTLRLAKLPLGLLTNFNAPKLQNGINRFVL
jgi:hypothetical protein